METDTVRTESTSSPPTPLNFCERSPMFRSVVSTSNRRGRDLKGESRTRRSWDVTRTTIIWTSRGNILQECPRASGFPLPPNVKWDCSGCRIRVLLWKTPRGDESETRGYFWLVVHMGRWFTSDANRGQDRTRKPYLSVLSKFQSICYCPFFLLCFLVKFVVRGGDSTKKG